MIACAVTEWEKECEGMAEVTRRAWAEDITMQGFLVSHALPGLSTAILPSPIPAINGKVVLVTGYR